jgi:sortase A
VALRARIARHLGLTLIVVGVLLFAYAGAIVFWRDPVTDVYTAYAQHGLRSDLNRETRAWQRIVVQREARTHAPVHTPARQLQTESARRQLRLVRGLAERFARQHRGHDGQPLGHIAIPRIGIREIFVEGTDYWGSLTKGPGRYTRTAYPGLGRTTAIAGHRTTWSAPFRHIDELRPGDPITLELPYGRFVYRVTQHRIVDDGDWSIVRDVGHDQLVLSACHPLYSAAQRYVIFARLRSVTLPGESRSIPAV